MLNKTVLKIREKFVNERGEDWYKPSKDFDSMSIDEIREYATLFEEMQYSQIFEFAQNNVYGEDQKNLFRRYNYENDLKSQMAESFIHRVHPLFTRFYEKERKKCKEAEWGGDSRWRFFIILDKNDENDPDCEWGWLFTAYHAVACVNDGTKQDIVDLLLDPPFFRDHIILNDKEKDIAWKEMYLKNLFSNVFDLEFSKKAFEAYEDSVKQVQRKNKAWR